eukprot:gb/GEZN01003263.1/.p1 GENE.gb/GEZN01003263.1/~~gb/GEZN01003263.1/.p1  ORF type:complete len:535 (-),score=79.67 gb/GEZN01003263.1/:449-2053(-)
MNDGGYVLLQDRPVSLFSPLRAFAGLWGVFLTGWGILHFSSDTNANPTVPPVPKQGVAHVLTSPGGGIGLLSASVAGSSGVLFVSGPVPAALALGAVSEPGWVYGAKLEQQQAVVTGRPDDILEGVLLSWPVSSITAKLNTADKLYLLNPKQPNQGSMLRSAVKAVRKDGSYVSARWYFRVVQSKIEPSASKVGRELLMLDELVVAETVRRPSLRNKSPWVADVQLQQGGQALAHFPSMDLAGKVLPGTTVLLKCARDTRGKLVGSNQSGKFGTPKCEYIIQLAKVSEPENQKLCSGGCWVGAHPGLGEKLAERLLELGVLDTQLLAPGDRTVSFKREVSKIAGSDMRVDFVLTAKSGQRTVLEVKTVPDTDYNPQTPPTRKECVFLGAQPYKRAAIFPCGKLRQKGPDNGKVVSARAIKHLRELSRIAQGQISEAGGERLQAGVLFMVVREDAEFFRPNQQGCSSFTTHLRDAAQAGVKVLAHQIRWSFDPETAKAKAFWLGPLHVQLDLLGTGNSTQSVTESEQCCDLNESM